MNAKHMVPGNQFKKYHHVMKAQRTDKSVENNVL